MKIIESSDDPNFEIFGGMGHRGQGTNNLKIKIISTSCRFHGNEIILILLFFSQMEF